VKKKRAGETVEIYASLAREEELERPTAIVLDLVPGPPADLLDCVQVAVWLRGLFERLGLSCYPKTAGTKGMQVYVPLNADATYEQTRRFAKAVAGTLAQKFPDRVVSGAARAERPGRVLIDWSRNRADRKSICVYSLCAGERPTVSTPLEWGEVEAALEAGEAVALVFDHAAALERVAARGDLFAPLLSEVQELPEI
jgi:bifunctional non-homologous end joining protein LigD